MFSTMVLQIALRFILSFGGLALVLYVLTKIQKDRLDIKRI